MAAGQSSVLFGGWIPFLVALAIAGLAGLLRGVTGFGSSLVLAPVLSIILGPVEAIAITLLIGISASVFLVPRYLSDYDRDVVLPLSLAGIAFLIPGVLSLSLLPAETTRHVIACVMIAITLLMQLPHITLRKSRWQCAVAGALGGLIMGATSMGGPPLVLYLTGQRPDPRQLKANIVVTVGALELAALVAIAFLQRIDITTFVQFAMLLPGFLLATHLAEQASGTIVGRTYQYIIFALLLATGIAALAF